MNKFFLKKLNLNYLYIVFLFAISFKICGNVIGNENKKNLRYDIQFSNIQVGQIIVSFENKNKKLSLIANSSSKGFVDMLYSYQSNLNAIIYKNENTWIPYKYTTNSIYNEKNFLQKLYGIKTLKTRGFNLTLH